MDEILIKVKLQGVKESVVNEDNEEAEAAN